MAEFPAVCVESAVDSLKDIAIRFCVKNPHAFCQYNPSEAAFELQEGLALPQSICERMLSICKEELKEPYFGRFLKLFKDTKRTRLQLVDLSNSDLTDEILEFITDHQITVLNISRCKWLTYAALNSIAKLRNLQSLIIGSGYHIFEMYSFKRTVMLALLGQNNYFYIKPPRIILPPNHSEPRSFLRLPSLKNLVIHDVPKLVRNLCFMTIMDLSQCLTHLDLSNCKVHTDRMNTSLASSALVSLTLRDVPNVNHLFHAICNIKTLRHLDISNTLDAVIMYDRPDEILEYIVTSLENLVHLDISGTNLAGVRLQDVYPGTSDDMTVTDIPGLASRVNRPLEFLGLFNSAYDACFRRRIPAKEITGHATEKQILTALQSYCACERMMKKVLFDLYYVVTSSGCSNIRKLLDLVIPAMKRHLDCVNIQINGSACIFHILKKEHVELLDTKMRRKIIKLSMEAMCSHSDALVLQNFYWILKEFKISDLLFESERLIIILQYLLVEGYENKPFVLEILLFLNDIARQMDGVKKELLSNRGLIAVILEVLYKSLQSFANFMGKPQCDDIIKAAWKTMLVLIEEASDNGAIFIQGYGVDLFLLCLKLFPEEIELLLNMLRILGNLAEVKKHRSHLIRDEYILFFCRLLNHENMEVSYNAARIFSHLASNGPWEGCKVRLNYSYYLLMMVIAIEKWDLDAVFVSNYRSFKPVLELLIAAEGIPEVQLWAVWTIVNLMKREPVKYNKLLREEGGLMAVQKLWHFADTHKIRTLEGAIICKWITILYYYANI